MVATVIAGEVRCDGATIGERALRGVGGLTRLGIGEADVVAIMLRNEAAFLEAMLIARTAGCWPSPNPTITASSPATISGMNRRAR